MTDTTNGLAILPNVPISLHPGSLGNIAPALSQEGTPGARALSITQAALTTSYSAYAKIEEAVGSLPLGDEVRMVNGRPTKLAAGAVDQLVAATEGVSTRVLSVVQKNYDELGKIEQALDQQVAAAIDDPARKTPVGLSVATEIRALTAVKLQPETRWNNDTCIPTRPITKLGEGASDVPHLVRWRRRRVSPSPAGPAMHKAAHPPASASMTTSVANAPTCSGVEAQANSLVAFADAT